MTKRKIIKIYVKEDLYRRIFNLLPIYKSFSKYFDKVISNDFEFRYSLNKIIENICIKKR